MGAELWRCPKCGHRFVSRNLWHSCVRVPVSAHFAGKPAVLRRTYQAYLRLARSFGPVHAYAQKSRIVFQVDVRFAGVMVRKDYLEAGMWLTRRAEHPRLARRLELNRDIVHLFRLRSPNDIDAALGDLMAEAYRIGCREHLAERKRR